MENIYFLLFGNENQTSSSYCLIDEILIFIYIFYNINLHTGIVNNVS